MAINVAINNKLNDPFKHCLVLAGFNSLKDNWKEEVNKFRDSDEHKILVGTFGAAGTGLNMQVANHLIFLDLPDNYGNLVQYEDRIHRIGSEKDVHIYYLLAKNTVDIDIYNLVADKKEITDAIVN